jgi:AcrR family transcriptional regulator
MGEVTELEPRRVGRRRRLRSVRSDETRAAIIDAAEVRFAAQGYAGTAMRDIAGDVSLNPASLYNYFSGKQGLYEAVLERGLRPIIELLDSLACGGFAPENLDGETDRLISSLAHRPHLARLLLHESLAGGEGLRRLSSRWLRPLYARALATVQEGGASSPWREDELPLLLMAFHHLILGHFALASMQQEVFDEDPLSEASMERQCRFMRRVVHLLVHGEVAPVPVQGRPVERTIFEKQKGA